MELDMLTFVSCSCYEVIQNSNLFQNRAQLAGLSLKIEVYTGSILPHTITVNSISLM